MLCVLFDLKNWETFCLSPSFCQQKEIEKLKYMHRNPVVRGLVASPEDWRWSSYRSYAYGEAGLVRINDWIWWEEKIRRGAG